MKLGIDIERSQWSEPFLEVVYNCGLDIVEIQKSEVLVKAASAITDDDLKNRKKIIALEKTSGGNIAYRPILQHPSVVRYVKSFNYKSVELHNRPCVDERLFTSFLPHNIRMKPPKALINQQEYNKIHLGWSILNYFWLREILSLENQEVLEKDDNRPIDVFFAGTLEYDNRNGERKSGDIISDHRKRCVEVLQSIKGYEILIVQGNFLSPQDYNQIICNTKVIVSPWGWGEPCYRDFEALLAGCVLIKPLTNFVQSACGLFENSHCIWTKPDFSDLGDIVVNALKDFKKSQSKRMKSREAIIKCANNLPNLVRLNLTI